MIFVSSALFSADELTEMVQRALASSPSIAAARQRVEQARLRHEELLEFLDPTLYGAAGRTERTRDLPLEPTSYTQLTDKSYEAQIGVEVPLAQGAYVTLGHSLRSYFDNEAYNDFYQNLTGLQVSVPLLRDRGFAVYSLRRAAALAEYEQEAANLLTSCQNLRRDIELAYITAYETLADSKIKQEAVARFLKFKEDAEKLVELKTVPDYEVSTAVIELQIGRDDDEISANAHKLALISLETLIGDGKEVVIAGGADSLAKACAQEIAVESPTVEAAMLARGDACAIMRQIDVAKANVSRCEEENKDQLNLSAGVTYQADDNGNPYGVHRYTTDHHWGNEINVVWTRPLDRTGAKSRILQNQAILAERNASLELQRLQVASEIRQAELNVRSAELRLTAARQGIKAAEDTIVAEQRRFQMGEGSSKAVLDAQKNFNTILARLNTAAADLMRARANHRHAIGYIGQEFVSKDAAQVEQKN